MRRLLTLATTWLLMTPVFFAHAIPVEGHRIMFSGPSPYSIEVAKQITLRGGNVTDVAVAIALAMSVTSPYFASLGGGGFALVKMGSQVDALDFRETAPRATNKDYYSKLGDKASVDGGHAVGVPGIPAGLFALHKKYGRLKWKDLFPEALRLARSGFAVSGEWANEVKSESARFNPAGRELFLRRGSVPLLPGETFTQPRLAQALELFRQKNTKGFYEGVVAQDIVKTVQAAGGKLDLQDLKDYKPRWLVPVTADFEGHKIHMMPPPSSGGVVIYGALRLIDQLKVKQTPPLSVDEFHLLGEIEARGFRGRWMLGDPDFHKNPLDLLLSNSYLDGLGASVTVAKVTPLKPLEAESTLEKAQTTHFNVMDNQGNAVAMTVTLNGAFGSGLISEKFGIALNNEMDDFTTRPTRPNQYGLMQGQGNAVAPGKRPLSSMTPTLVEKDGKIVAALGAPGGPRIISAVLQTLYRLLARGLDPDQAIQAPRVHHQFSPNTLYVDRGRMAYEVLQGLKAKGHSVEESWGGKAYVVRLRPDGVLEGAYDSRGEGAAGGI